MPESTFRRRAKRAVDLRSKFMRAVQDGEGNFHHQSCGLLRALIEVLRLKFMRMENEGQKVWSPGGHGTTPLSQFDPLHGGFLY